MFGSEYVLIRSIHVLGAGLLFGSSALVWLLFLSDRTVSVRLLTQFEILFWPVFALVVFTGMGNIVGFGVAPPETDAGIAFTVKLTLLLVIVCSSVIRSVLVRQRADTDRSRVGGSGLRRLYAATGWLLAMVVLLAGVVTYG